MGVAFSGWKCGDQSTIVLSRFVVVSNMGLLGFKNENLPLDHYRSPS